MPPNMRICQQHKGHARSVNSNGLARIVGPTVFRHLKTVTFFHSTVPVCRSLFSRVHRNRCWPFRRLEVSTRTEAIGAGSASANEAGGGRGRPGDGDGGADGVVRPDVAAGAAAAAAGSGGCGGDLAVGEL